MLSLFLAIKKVIKSFWGILKQEDTRALLFMMLVTLISGTVFYSHAEKLSALDAFYFSFTTLTTIGYGDIVPTTDMSKIFTIFYSLIGLGIMAIFISTVAKSYINAKATHKHGHAAATTEDKAKEEA